MDKIYYNPANNKSFGGVDRLKGHRKQHTVKNWLKFQDAYTLHKPVRKTFPRRRVLVGGIDSQWQIDLVDLSSISHLNKKYKFILTCIDVLSKYAWAIALKDKSADSVVNAMKRIFESSGRIPKKIQVDKGKEFINRRYLALMKTYKISLFLTENDDIKSSIVERFNRTLKSRMWRYFTYTKKKRYIDKLDDFLESYNNSRHRTIKMAPADVTKSDEVYLLQNMYDMKPSKKSILFKIGDTVRIVMTRMPFKKGYTGHWSEEIFIVTEKVKSIPVTYKLKDLMDENIKGTFYPQELQIVGVTKDKAYVIEEVLKTRRKNNKIEYFVKWKGYGSKFNSWVLKEDVMV